MKTFGIRLRLKTIKMTYWVVRDGMMIARQALNADDPDYPYNWIKSTFNADPAEFGYFAPQGKNFDERGLGWRDYTY